MTPNIESLSHYTIENIKSFWNTPSLRVQQFNVEWNKNFYLVTFYKENEFNLEINGKIKECLFSISHRNPPNELAIALHELIPQRETKSINPVADPSDPSSLCGSTSGDAVKRYKNVLMITAQSFPVRIDKVESIK